MIEKTSLEVELRDRAGKGAARATRREGRVPAVIYGDKKAPVLVSLDPRVIIKEASKKGFWTRQFEIKAGKVKEAVMCQDVQFHPVTDAIMHVDFIRTVKGAKMNVNVPLEFINEEACVGIKEGGVLNIVRREIEIICTPENMPSSIQIDLASVVLGDSIKVADIDIRKNVEINLEDTLTVATIAAPTVMKEEEETPAEEVDAAPEVEATAQKSEEASE